MFKEFHSDPPRRVPRLPVGKFQKNPSPSLSALAAHPTIHPKKKSVPYPFNPFNLCSFLKHIPKNHNLSTPSVNPLCKGGCIPLHTGFTTFFEKIKNSSPSKKSHQITPTLQKSLPIPFRFSGPSIHSPKKNRPTSVQSVQPVLPLTTPSKKISEYHQTSNKKSA
ncbi:MAG: hypothetical protein IPI65_15370 [Bacteroidetes bacterium]|nr:hypothetical protein [Bacteroidota bacterium]